MKCIWCNSDTTTNKAQISESLKYANAEHIFPDAVGGKRTLDLGKVCEECNSRLGNEVDKFLKTENFAFMLQYQNSSYIQGKPIGRVNSSERRKRKESEIYKIQGYGGGTLIERDESSFNHIKLTNLASGTAGDLIYNDLFSKALHKCALNVILDEQDYEYVKKNYQELIDFINTPNTQEYQRWSYGVCYFNFLFEPIHFEPFCLQKIEGVNNNLAVVLIFPCGIFVVSSKPDLVDASLLKIVGDNPPYLKNWDSQGFSYIDYYQSNFSNENRFSFGDKLKFNLIKKEIKGRENHKDLFYLLTNCKTCGQVNPTGINLPKTNFLEKEHSSWIGANRNSWNRFTDDDLRVKGLLIEKWDAESLELYKDQGITYPQKYDVKEMNIQNCSTRCINCFEEILFEAKDCFL